MTTKGVGDWINKARDTPPNVPGLNPSVSTSANPLRSTSDPPTAVTPAAAWRSASKCSFAWSECARFCARRLAHFPPIAIDNALTELRALVALPQVA
jgi:hypothetical protein